VSSYMQRALTLFLFSLVMPALMAQNKDTANISVTNYKLYPGTYSWRGNDQFYDMTSWDSSPYTQGHLKQGTQFRMNYRLLLPQGYNNAYKPGYPLIVMLHGAGERGNCWNDNCYCPDPAGCSPNSIPIDGTDPRFLNNDHNLVHGGSPHLSARNRAGMKLPNDPTLAANAFPGFVLFPQNTNQWRNSGNPASSDVSNAIRIIRLLSKQYNIDQDRIYIHGLSMGAQALLEALNYADWLFAAAAPMSPINFSQTLEYDSVRNIPFWIFQGGQDLNPKPAETEGMIKKLLEKGAEVRYSLYPNLGHGTWNRIPPMPNRIFSAGFCPGISQTFMLIMVNRMCAERRVKAHRWYSLRDSWPINGNATEPSLLARHQTNM
jgi:predicted esterase